jgi:DNA-binding Xre family transcriptional regulator
MKLGFPRSTYYAMKRGDNISSHTVNQLCKILKCNVSDIMEYIADEDSTET